MAPFLVCGSIGSLGEGNIEDSFCGGINVVFILCEPRILFFLSESSGIYGRMAKALISACCEDRFSFLFAF